MVPEEIDQQIRDNEADCYANENFPLPVVEALRELGHNLLTTYESGKVG